VNTPLGVCQIRCPWSVAFNCIALFRLQFSQHSHLLLLLLYKNLVCVATASDSTASVQRCTGLVFIWLLLLVVVDGWLLPGWPS